MNYPDPNARRPLRMPRVSNTTGATRALAGARGQTRTTEQDMTELGMVRLRCAAHLVEYYAQESSSPACPMCTLEKQLDDARVALIEHKNEVAALKAEAERLRVQVEIGAAIKSAIEILGVEDRAWLKIQMYQYKIDKSIQLKAIHTGENAQATGFMSIPRVGDPEAYVATSIGGVAMAGYLDEALSCYGPAQGMGIMLKAWWQALPGGQ